MTQKDDRKGSDPSPGGPPVLRLARTFVAPRDLVFEAWSSAERVKEWFCPEGFSVPTAEVQMRVGGAFAVCMLAPDGVEHWTHGTIVELARPSRLVIDMDVRDKHGVALFRALTELNFVDVPGGTRLEVTQTYTFADQAKAAPMVEGAPEGWRQTLEKLEQSVARRLARTTSSAVHDTFRIERSFEAPVELLYRALSDVDAKSQWFAGPAPQWKLLERTMDFRVGGHERLRGQWEGGMVSTFDATYHDIVGNERIVYSYTMHLDQRKISVSLATLELKALGPRRTALALTEQGVFLDGYRDEGSREKGTGQLLDRLAESLRLPG